MHARKAVELKEKKSRSRGRAGLLFAATEKATEAKEAFKQYLKLDPNSP